MVRRTPLLAAALAIAGSLATLAPAASAAAVTAPTEVPLPPISVTQVCGPRNDVLTVDPTWLATWGDKVQIFPNSLTFQGGADGDYARPSGLILEAYRADYRWAGSGTNATSWLLYPGTVTPVLDLNIPCAGAVEVVDPPTLRQTELCGPRNDTVAFADATSAQRWTVVSTSWSGQVLTVTLKTNPGYTSAAGDTITQQFTDQVNRSSAGKCSGGGR